MDFDLSSGPILADITVNGRADQGGRDPEQARVLYVFDRCDARPAVWPESKSDRSAKGDVPGSGTRPTRTIPDQAFRLLSGRIHAERLLIDFTPELRERL